MSKGKRRKTKKRKQFTEFSKRVIVAMTILWFLGAIYGAVICARNPENLPSLLEYIGNPMSVGIIGYLLKSAYENRTKIERGVPDEQFNNEAVG